VESAAQPHSEISRRALLALLAALVALPALAVMVGVAGGRVVFVLCREPKLAVFMVLGSVLLAAFSWTHRRRLDLTPWLAVARRPEVLKKCQMG
jgi:F0F1-type ATP synthase membrane subunit c/vacuolar-type H+-ATPase subunit K